MNKRVEIILAREAHRQLVEWRKKPSVPEVKKAPGQFKKDAKNG